MKKQEGYVYIVESQIIALLKACVHCTIETSNVYLKVEPLV